ncbi:MAG: hypothetical protein HOP30_19735 [Cyclobacteriaceae bacterium]|nr:hypothetical protein [Cyclobacteriaceae bacterium]
MNEKQIQLIQSSWKHLANRQEDLSDHFYKNLTNYLPERKADLKKIKQDKGFDKVIEAIHHLVSNLPEFNRVESEFSMLVDQFVVKGISQTDYATALVAFLHTLEESLKKIWTPELAECWIFAFASFHQHLSRKLEDKKLKAVI